MGRHPALALMAALLLAAPGVRAAGEQVLADRQWENPATIEAAAARPALHNTVATFLATDDAWVRVAHAGGARGSAWAHEVRNWLIALGIPGARIQIDPGMAERAHLRLAVHQRGDRL